VWYVADIDYRHEFVAQLKELIMTINTVLKNLFGLIVGGFILTACENGTVEAQNVQTPTEVVSAVPLQLTGDYSALCTDQLIDHGATTYVAYDGDWSGLQQTALVEVGMFTASGGAEAMVFTATPGKSDWGVPAGCTVYIGTIADNIFTATSGQRPGESVTYSLSGNVLSGTVDGNGISNSAEMQRAAGLTHVR